MTTPRASGTFRALASSVARAVVVAGALVLVMSGRVGPAGAQEPSRPTLAPAGAEAIRAWSSTITVNKDDSVSVVEMIDYDFGVADRHGIFRYVPVLFPYAGPTPDDATYDRSTPLEDFQVSTSPDTPDDVDTDEEDGVFVAKIGDKDTLISGRHRYTVSYRLRGVFNAFDDHDELYLNITGNGWQVPIESITARVLTPRAATEAACFAGPAESRLPCSSIAVTPDAVTLTQDVVPSGGGVTVVVSLPKGVVDPPSPILKERFSLARAFQVTPATGAAGGALGLGGAALVGSLLWRKGRDRQYAGGAVDASFGNTTGEEVPVPLVGRLPDTVEFVPPDGIRPGHLGTLWDERANDLDVTAMIIDLAVRGYLRIEEVTQTESGMFGFTKETPDYRFVRVKPADDTLLSAERVCLDSLFQGGDEVELSSLKQQFRPRLELIEAALVTDAVQAGWFPAAPKTVQGRWVALGLAVTVLGGALVWLAARYTHAALVALPIPLVGLLIMATAHLFARRSARGTAMLRRVRGFKMIFDAGEGERQRWAENKQLFSQYLPYAIVFGCAERWATTFQDLGLSPAEMGVGVWYISPYGYNPIAFGHAMSSFSTMATGTIAAAAPSSVSSGGSGFGGGGFSGGGFGGGGGGSW